MIFFLFFSEFSCPGQVWTEFGSKIFFFLSPPISSHFGEKYCRKEFFFNFLNFLAIFFGVSFHGSSMNRIQVQNFFFSFSTNLIPFWLKIMPEMVFYIFSNFLGFFSEFPCTGRVWTEFRNKFFFFLGLSQPVLDRNNAGINFFNFLNFFTIFSGIF